MKMLKNMTLGRRLGVIITSLLLLLAATSVTAIVTGGRLHDSADEALNVNTKIVRDVGDIRYHLEYLRGQVRLMLIDAMRRDAGSIEKRSAAIVTGYKDLLEDTEALKQTSSLASTKTACDSIAQKMAEWRSLITPVEASARQFKVEEAAGLVPAPTVVSTAVQELIGGIAKEEDGQLQAAEQRVERTYDMGWYVSVALFGLAAGVGLAAYFMVRSTTKTLASGISELTRGAEQVSSASGQVAGAAQSLSEGAAQQAASLEETSASIEEMSSMTRQNADNSHQAAAMMLETERAVGQANVALQDMTQAMSAIKESSDSVSKIIKTIDEIAFQTNILALNAAVEAARAGEAGMGFAVVADEVRALAQRSAQAARDTSVLIEQSIVRSNEGQDKVRLVATTIESVTSRAVKVKELVESVSTASNEQAQGISQVSRAVSEMERITQTTAATAEENAAASEELSAQAETTLSVVTELGVLVGSVARRHTDPAPRAAAKVTPFRAAPKPAAAPVPASTRELRPTGTSF